jgi:hypothetical protein
VRCRRDEDFDVAAFDSKTLQKRVHCVLRMVRRRRCREPALRIADAADDLPGIVFEIGIQSRQHDRALRKLCDNMQEFRRGRHRSGRTRRDHGTCVARGETSGFGFDEKIPPRRGLDFLNLLEISGPGLARDPQEFERILPVFVELIRHQGVKRVPPDPPCDHVIHQARQIACQRQRRCRPADHKRRRDRAFRPDRHQPRQRQPALELAKLRRNVERNCSTQRIGFFREGQFVLVDIAERDDARQQYSSRVQLVEKDLAHQSSGAAGRQIKCGFRQSLRMRPGREIPDQPAIDQRGDDGAQERHGCWNTKYAHGLPDFVLELRFRSSQVIAAPLMRTSESKQLQQ